MVITIHKLKLKLWCLCRRKKSTEYNIACWFRSEMENIFHPLESPAMTSMRPLATAIRILDNGSECSKNKIDRLHKSSVVFGDRISIYVEQWSKKGHQLTSSTSWANAPRTGVLLVHEDMEISLKNKMLYINLIGNNKKNGKWKKRKWKFSK